MENTIRHFHSFDAATDHLLSHLGSEIRVATPLGLGKPNQLINSLYARIKDSPERHLHLYTALSLDPPSGSSDLEKRFLTPFTERHFGLNYPRFSYLHDIHNNQLPENVRIHEFYFQAGQALKSTLSQQDYVSLNYTHVAPYILSQKIDVILQMVAKKTDASGNTRYSLSCNPDLTLDVADLYKKHGLALHIVAVVHPGLPFVGEDAEVGEDFFSVIVEDSSIYKKLFALPRTPVDATDFMIGFLASHLLEDDGTLQIGIGALSDALVYSTCLRHQQNSVFLKLSEQILAQRRPATELELFKGPFQAGLYGTSEMVMDGFMHLRRAGILKREVQEPLSKKKRYLHGAFFLGSEELYKWLRELSDEDYTGLNMTRVSIVNDLYDYNEFALRRQRRKARFFNTCMNITLLGGAASDTLENGSVVSGVGGQYNFVAMAHELDGAASVLMLRSTRWHKGQRSSNIVWGHDQLTIPRHLRDIVITEYGIAYLRGKTDEDVIRELLNITDSEFQEDLKQQAQKAGKLHKDYQIPPWARHNNPEILAQQCQQAGFDRHFPAFPFGSDFTLSEEKLALALGHLNTEMNISAWRLLPLLRQGLSGRQNFTECLERMELLRPGNPKEWLYRTLLTGALHRTSKRLTSSFSEEQR
ncbi:acetyl-CoA hydrolase [Bdellovibrio bacteriovorus]|uniref:acetyl-CoA hydrolase/transferase C-terminal domain-containing protein n=1 Tax=Bdellovibrio bacteriovorus TaxID=959 RepID=UPI0021D05CE4|nr:acetyl-CoA hydrolase/transferase C-terminal domain-containing protein [Bdellovibrio bacteriovorus]UXR64581.1 acetyl-CoA hydrolase [Bdellovibrio bacteriovorus]